MSDRKHYPALDGLRGIGFFIVFIAHFGQAYKTFYIAGKVGVGLFFVLSAFFLTQAFLKNFETMNSMKSWTRYLGRRVLRLYPMYIVILLVELLVGRYSWSMVVHHLLLLDARQHYWTIPVEFQFYVLMPFLAYIGVKVLKKDYRKGIIFLTSILVVLGVFYERVTGVFIQPLASQTNLIFYLPSFLIGVILACVVERYQIQKDHLTSRSLNGLMVSAILGIAFLFPESFNLFWKGGTSKALFWLFTLYSILWSIIVFVLINSNSFLTKILEHSWIRLLGAISYSAYLMHILVIAFVQQALQLAAGPGFIISFLLTLALSYATYQLIEKPALRFGIMKS